MTRPGKYTQRDVDYEDRPEQVKHREARNAARRREEKASHILPGKDVAHRVSLGAGGGNKPSNVHIETVKKNRGWRKGESGYKVPREK